MMPHYNNFEQYPKPALITRDTTHKVCTVCGEDKPLSEYHKRGGFHAGRSWKPQPHCAICDNKKAREWYLKNKARRAAYMREYRRRKKKNIFSEVIDYPAEVDCE